MTDNYWPEHIKINVCSISTNKLIKTNAQLFEVQVKGAN